jgi:hypothetical protein
MNRPENDHSFSRCNQIVPRSRRQNRNPSEAVEFRHASLRNAIGHERPQETVTAETKGGQAQRLIRLTQKANLPGSCARRLAMFTLRVVALFAAGSMSYSSCRQ